MTTQVCQGAALPDEVIHKKAAAARFNDAGKRCLTRQTGETIGPCVCHHVGLDDLAIHRSPKRLCQTHRQRLGNRIASARLFGMDARKRHAAACRQLRNFLQGLKIH